MSKKKKNRPAKDFEEVVPEEVPVTEESVEDVITPDAEEGGAAEEGMDIADLLQRYLPDFAAEDAVPAEDEGINAEPEYVDETFDEEPVQYAEEEAPASDPDEYTEYELSEEADVYEESSGEYEEEYTPEVEDYSAYEYVSDEAAYRESAGLAEEPVIPEGTELDETDINLMVAFGLDEELARTMGADVAERLTEEIHAEAKLHEEKSRRAVENEFLDPSQIPEIASDLKRRHRHLKGKMLFAGLLSLILLIYENLEILGVQFGSFLNPAVYPVVYIMVSLQIMLFVAAIGYEQVLSGCGNLFTGKINPSSIAFIGNVGAIVYSVIQAETTVIPNEPALFNSCAAFMTLFAIITDYLAVKRTMLSFNIVSAKRPKYVVSYMSAADAGIPDGLFEDDDVSEGGVLRIVKSKFVDDFFSRTADRTKADKAYSAAYLFISVILALVMGLFVGLRDTSSGIGAVGAGFVTFFSTMPLSLFLSMSFPFYKGVSDAYDFDGTIVGESSAEEYADAGAVCFDDIDAFPSYGVKVQNIKIYNNHRIDRVLYYAASAFKVAGGPLSDVFEVATMEIGTSESVELTAAAEGYLGAKVDGKNIIFGRADSLREYGINLPDSVILEDETLSDELCPMYMLREGKLMAKLILRYMMDSDFEFLMKDLSDEGMCACIKTFDPNIDDSLVTMRLGGGRYPFRVLRYNSTDEINRVNERVSSGIVSRGTTKPLLGIIGSCSRMLSARKSGFIIGVVSAVIAAAIVWLLVASGGVSTLGSFAVVIYQLLWTLPVFFISKVFLK